MDILKSIDKEATKDLGLEFMDDVDKTVMYALVGLEFACNIACYKGFKQLWKNAGINGFGRSAIAFGMACMVSKTGAFNFARPWIRSLKRHHKEVTNGESE